MPRSKYGLLFTITSLMSLGTAARAQTPACTLVVPALQTWASGQGIPNAPYVGTVRKTFVQELPGGNSIHGVSISHEARDSAGRTMYQGVQGCSFGEDGQRHEKLMTRVNDPIAKTTTTWNTGGAGEPKRATISHLNVSRPTTEWTAEERAMMLERQKAFEAELAYVRKEKKSEDLGSKQINGITARGWRLTRTIPSGEEGNYRPLVVVIETWRSADFGLTLYAMQDDPRSGRLTVEFQDLEMREPDPGWFVPPSDYKVIENQKP
jgi:hypothetical protein